MNEKYYLFINDEYEGFSVEEFSSSEEVVGYIQELERFEAVDNPDGLMDLNTYCIFKGRACKIKKTVEVVE